MEGRVIAISPFKTFLAGEVLTASDLNSSFAQITDNGLSLISPLTGNIDLDGHDVIGDADGNSKLTFSTNDRMDIVLGGTTLFYLDGTTASAVNGLKWLASATGTAVQVQAIGSDSNVSINLVPKGTGVLQASGFTVTSPAAAGLNIAARTNSGAPNSKIDITADELLVKDANGVTAVLSAVSVTIDIAASGANGLDTGTEGSSTWYYGWVIAKPDGTVAGILSTSATAPTMPSGYSLKALVTAVRNNGSSNFIPYRQKGNEVNFEAKQTALSSTTQDASETTVSFASLAPSIATRIFAQCTGQVSSSGGGSISSRAIMRIVSGSDFARAWLQCSASSASAWGFSAQVPNISQQVFVLFENTTNIDTSNFQVDALGFKLPGGGE